MYGISWAFRWLSGKESICQYRGHGFDSWVGKIPWRKKWQPRQQKRHWCIEQSFGLCGRGQVWDLGEWHWNMYNIIYETSRQSWFDARYWMLGAGALGRSRGMVWGGRRKEGGGFRMGNTCIPVVDSCWCMAKPIQYRKVVSLQLKQMNLYKNKSNKKWFRDWTTTRK